MLKIAVFDGGYGGEFFADRLEEVLPIVEVIRVIDWRNAEKILLSSRHARKAAEAALRPYIGNVDLIIFANHLLSITSLRYFKRKYKHQKFVGFDLKKPDSFKDYDVLILTTKAVARTINYYNYIMRLKRKNCTLTLDEWPSKIDDGELSEAEIYDTLRVLLIGKNIRPNEIVLACSQFDDIKEEIRKTLGQNLKIYDSFDDTIRKACKVLKLRGRTGKKSSK